MVTLEELGARAWINSHPTEAQKKNLTCEHFDTVPGAIGQFCLTVGLQRSQLRRYGRGVRARGYAKKTAYKQVTLAWNETVRILRRVRTTWSQVDGRVPQDEKDTVERYRVGPSWSGNSCAIDAAIFCGLRLDVGRTQADQLTLVDTAQLPTAAKRFREAIGEKWGTLSGESRNRMRDRIRQEVVRAYPRVGSMTSELTLETVMDACFEGLPQLTYTDVHGNMCCDGHIVVPKPGLYSQKHFLEFSEHTLKDSGTVQDALRAHFGRSSSLADPSLMPCSTGADCNRVRTRVITVVDRMPPVLMVGFTQRITLQLEKSRHALQDQRFAVQVLYDRVEFEYEPLGCVMHHLHPSHFTVRWLADRPGDEGGRIICHDGLRGQGVYYVDDWFAGAPHLPSKARERQRMEHGPLIVFYKKKG